LIGLSVHKEKELLGCVAAGEEAAFTELFNAYNSLLGAHIYRLTESGELAREIVQDVFLKIWLTRETLVNVENFRVYLFVVSKNHALNCLKKLRSERVKHARWQSDVLYRERHAPAFEEAPSYDSLIDHAISQLPPQQKKVYLHSRHERLTYGEIARKMDLSPETVKKYVKLAGESISHYILRQLEQERLMYLLVIGLMASL
jgi:RNA polymerase sigma factor (sigma-70 family)